LHARQPAAGVNHGIHPPQAFRCYEPGFISVKSSDFSNVEIGETFGETLHSAKRRFGLFRAIVSQCTSVQLRIAPKTPKPLDESIYFILYPQINKEDIVCIQMMC
jgi:hypothetical protein